MTDYNPPIKNVSIFDPVLFSIANPDTTEEYLTRENADSLYLHYPFAQGTETFPENIVLSGVANTNYIQFPDGSKQYTASSAQQFQPVFVNYCDTQTTSGSGYSLGPIITFNGTWYANEWVMIRICQQQSSNKDGTGNWQRYGSTYGTLIFRPYYFGTGSWAGSSNQQAYTSNSGNYMGPVNKAMYYSANTNQGDTGYFKLLGNNNTIQVIFYSSGGFNGWSTSIQLEYISSTGGGSVVFSNGTGTNNSLP